jgi:hypothetical protein
MRPRQLPFMHPRQLPLTSIKGHKKKDDVTEVLISLKRNTIEMANSDVRNRKPSEPTPELNKRN